MDSLWQTVRQWERWFITRAHVIGWRKDSPIPEPAPARLVKFSHFLAEATERGYMLLVCSWSCWFLNVFGGIQVRPAPSEF
jgi:hypothetical protein